MRLGFGGRIGPFRGGVSAGRGGVGWGAGVGPFSATGGTRGGRRSSGDYDGGGGGYEVSRETAAMVMAIIGPLTATIPPVLLLAFTERDEVNKLSDALWVSGAFFLLGAGESYFAWRTLRADERPRRRGFTRSNSETAAARAAEAEARLEEGRRYIDRITAENQAAYLARQEKERLEEERHQYWLAVEAEERMAAEKARLARDFPGSHYVSGDPAGD